MKTLITNAEIVNEGRRYGGSIIIEDGRIIEITDKPLQPDASVHETIDASGCLVMPGVIDSHVHFREPGLTAKADIVTESRAAAAGGVTTYFDMPNTVPQTTTPAALEEKFRLAAEKSCVNYSFFFGATNDNLPLIDRLDATRIPGVKLFMGSSTGNMLVDRQEALERIFSTVRMPVMAHCEDTAIINRNMEEARRSDPRFPDVALHPLIRSAEACYESTSLAVSLARRYGTRLHVAHLTTARELELFAPGDPKITAEATVGHLFFTDADYARLGARIKVNPAVKTAADRDALRRALLDGRITTIGTDHAPHLPEQKEGGCDTAASGMPMIQFSLVTMLELVDEGVLPVERMVELMCHAPARLFGVRDRGFLRPGCWADIVIVSPRGPWTVTPELIESRCGWSPMEGHRYRWRVERTLCNGRTVYDGRTVDDTSRGMEVTFG
ncbi:MAG: dihydroorotase [Prevotella sp.]|nr:dihydroorotase [Prevotella sp.]MDO4933752.1 dihydroorotase [Prevotella sp.]